MGKIVYYIDHDKITEKAEKFGEITITAPVIKTTGTFSDAGVDLFAAYNFTVPAQSYVIAETFVGFYMEPGTAGLLWPRGGDSFLVGAGVIDTGYTGTIKVKIINPYGYDMVFRPGDSVGQLVLFKKGVPAFPELTEVEKIDKVNIEMRGDDGRIVKEFEVQID